MRDSLLINDIDALLPQTQCRQCGFADCKSYATAIAEGIAKINQCPPGGEEGVHALANLLGTVPISLDRAYGVPKPKAIALIDEQDCIGCTLCIVACPVDAIVGASRQMHTILAAECTGCELCLAPCPVDCIKMIPDTNRNSAKTSQADLARSRYAFRLQRLENQKQERKAGKHQSRTTELPATLTVSSSQGSRKAALYAELERIKRIKSGGSSSGNNA